MPYLDAFVVPVSKQNLTAYRRLRLARTAGTVWRERGAVKLKPDEVAVFSWIVFPSRHDCTASTWP